MLLAFWYSARNDGESDQLSMIGRTKKEIIGKLEAFDPENRDGWKTSFDEPEKRVLIYADGHDLMCQMAGEGGGYAASMTVEQFKLKYPEIYAKQ